MVQSFPNWCNKFGKWVEKRISALLSSTMLSQLPAWILVPESVENVQAMQDEHLQDTTLDAEDCKSKVTAVAFHATEPWLAMGCEDGTIRVWNVDTKKLVIELGDKKTCDSKDWHTDVVTSVAFCAGDSLPALLVSGSDDGTGKIWDVESGTCAKTFIKESESVTAVAFCDADGQTLASGCDGAVSIWQLEWNANTHQCDVMREVPLKGLGRATPEITSIDFYSNEWVAAGSINGMLIWNLRTRKCVALDDGSYTHSVAFDPSDGRLASGCADGSVKIWDVDGEERLAVLAGNSGHSRPVNSLAFHPTDMRLASASRDGTVKIWACPEVSRKDWKCDVTLMGHSQAVVSVAFSSDGQRIASSSDDQTVQLWDADREECERKTLQLLRKHSWAAKSAHWLRTEVGGLSADTIGTNVETLYVAAFTFGGLSYTRTLLQAFDCTQNNDKSWYLDAEITTKCMQSYSSIWPWVFFSVLLTMSCITGGRSIFRMARGTEFVHISGKEDDGSEEVTFCDSPRVRWPRSYIDGAWLRCVWDVVVFVKYWHSLLSTALALVVLSVPWKCFELLWWAMNSLRLHLTTYCKQNLNRDNEHIERTDAESTSAAKPAAEETDTDVQSESRTLTETDRDGDVSARNVATAEKLKDKADELCGTADLLSQATYEADAGDCAKAVETLRATLRFDPHKSSDEIEQKLANARHKAHESWITALRHYDHALWLDPADTCSAASARSDLLNRPQMKDSVTLWLYVVRPFVELACMHRIARFIKNWQSTLESKGSKENGAWKKSIVTWKLFAGALFVLYGALPFYLWYLTVLPNDEEVERKHERMVLLASIGLTLYVLGLVRYWIELQRQGT